MAMTVVDLIQGTPEWAEHRAKHFNASEAAAMLGISPYKSRTQFIHEFVTGEIKEVDAFTQKRFDDGHRFEAAARVLAEGIIGKELYPVIGVDGKLSASFDGITDDDGIIWEHKTANDAIRRASCAEDLPEHILVQIEQQLMLSGAGACLFHATKWDADINACLEDIQHWVTPNVERRQRIIAGWQQFAADVESYVPQVILPAAVAGQIIDLPSVSVRVDGEITIHSNFKEFEIALKDFISDRLIRHPETDQDFADLGAQIKSLKKAEAALEAAEANMVGQVESIDTTKRTIDMLHKMTRDNRLMAEKLLDAEKTNRRNAILLAAKTELVEHVEKINEQFGQQFIKLEMIQADFAAAMKGKKSITSLTEAAQNELRAAKAKAGELSIVIFANLAKLTEAGNDFLFADRAALVLKPADDLQAIIKSRLSDHRAKQEAEAESQRAKIRAEEQAKVEREHAEKRRIAEAWEYSLMAAIRHEEEQRIAAERTAQFQAVEAEREQRRIAWLWFLASENAIASLKKPEAETVAAPAAVILQPAHEVDIRLEAIRERITGAIANMNEASLRRVWATVEDILKHNQ